jgi:hypothetical protein
MKNLLIFIVITILFAAAIFSVTPMMFKGAPPFRLIVLCIDTIIIYFAWSTYKKFFVELKSARLARKAKKEK